MTGKTLKRGDHIYVNYGGYTHHGIYCGDDKVIHYGARSKVREVLLSDFAQKHHVSVQKYYHSYPAERVVSRAKKRLGEKKYNLVFNNCEHFAVWCKVGKSRSMQVENPVKSIIKLISHNQRKIVKKVARKSEKPLKVLSKSTQSTFKKVIKSIF